jgi:hypothetical protein
VVGLGGQPGSGVQQIVAQYIIMLAVATIPDPKRGRLLRGECHGPWLPTRRDGSATAATVMGARLPSAGAEQGDPR